MRACVPACLRACARVCILYDVTKSRLATTFNKIRNASIVLFFMQAKLRTGL